MANGVDLFVATKMQVHLCTRLIVRSLWCGMAADAEGFIGI